MRFVERGNEKVIRNDVAGLGTVIGILKCLLCMICQDNGSGNLCERNMEI